jgi:hypothetical protein
MTDDWRVACLLVQTKYTVRTGTYSMYRSDLVSYHVLVSE